MLKKVGSVWHFRRRVPQNLRQFFDSGEIWLSVRTGNVTLARARAGIVYARVERVFEMARGIRVKIDNRSPEEIKYELEHLKQVAEWDAIEYGLDRLEREREAEKSAQELKAVEAQLKQSRIINERALATLTEPRNHAPIVKEKKEPAKPTVWKIKDAYFAHSLAFHKKSNQVVNQERTTVEIFREICGDKPVNTYDRGDVSRFLGALRRLPAVYGRSPKDKKLTFTQIIARADEAKALRLSEKTVKRHLSALSQFFVYCVDQGYLTVSARLDMFGEHAFKTKGSAKSQRDAWTPDELTKLFKSPVWTGCESKHRLSTPGAVIEKDHHYWLPLLAVYHGARLEELADLIRSDISQEGPIFAIKIQEDTREQADGTTRERRLKTANSARTIPLHPELVRLGFVDYLKETARNPTDPIFPKLLPQGKDGKRGPRFTRWFVEYRKAIGVYKSGLGTHSFRHTAITRLSNAITSEDQRRHRNLIMGHIAGDATEGDLRYDKGDTLENLYKTLCLIKYPEIDILNVTKMHR